MSITRWTIPPHVEAAARAMTKRERVDHLKAHGWRRIGSQSWRAPEQADHSSYTLAAAIRTQLDRQAAS